MIRLGVFKEKKIADATVCRKTRQDMMLGQTLLIAMLGNTKENSQGKFKLFLEKDNAPAVLFSDAARCRKFVKVTLYQPREMLHPLWMVRVQR